NPMNQFKIGDRVNVNRKNNAGKHKNYTGVVQFVGTTKFAKGEVIGVELDDADAGSHDGSKNGTRYFECARGPHAGIFVRADVVSLRVPMEDLYSQVRGLLFTCMVDCAN
ncbi:hypothetical protein HK100_010637, partial [Physocladia obscura]